MDRRRTLLYGRGSDWDHWVELPTVSPVVPVIAGGLETRPVLAVIIVLPADTPVTKPEALTVATAALEELQITVLVRSWVLVMGVHPPQIIGVEKVPVAVNCNVDPRWTVGLGGVIAIETSDKGVGLLGPCTVRSTPLWVARPD